MFSRTLNSCMVPQVCRDSIDNVDIKFSRTLNSCMVPQVCRDSISFAYFMVPRNFYVAKGMLTM